MITNQVILVGILESIDEDTFSIKTIEFGRKGRIYNGGTYMILANTDFINKIKKDFEIGDYVSLKGYLYQGFYNMGIHVETLTNLSD